MHIVTADSLNVASASDPLADDRWQQSVRCAVRSPEELCQVLQLPAVYSAAAKRAPTHFGLFVPREYLEKIPPGNPAHPLLRQILPMVEELDEGSAASGFSRDPVADRAALVAPGLLQKYASRVLLVLTGACAVHCRYCFRRYYPYEEMPRGAEDWQPALAQIEKDSTIDEVILSGGDPLMLVDSSLQQLSEKIARIEHVKRLRIHTRLPIMIPSRVNDALISWLTGTRLTPFVVVHANHALEIDADVATALSKMVDAGVVVLNQSVLLRGVNDSVAALEVLLRRLVDIRVMPYYLHQLDRVLGSEHFEVSDGRSRELIAELRRRLPGYAVPRLAREVEGASHKEILA